MNKNDFFTAEEKKQLLHFARAVIKAKSAGTPLPDMPDLGDKLRQRCSCFVTLNTRDTGTLRGCIGNIAAYEDLGDNILHNAVNAAFNDPRFPSLEPDELDGTELEISVLTPLEDIASAADFIVGVHGIVLTLRGRSAVFLPQVATEQGWDRDTTLSHLCMKAGLPPDSWKLPETKFKVFTAIVFSEKEFS